MQWYYVKDGGRMGPVGQADFRELVLKGVIATDTLVWHEGLPEWRPYGELHQEYAACGEAAPVQAELGVPLPPAPAAIASLAPLSPWQATGGATPNAELRLQAGECRKGYFWTFLGASTLMIMILSMANAFSFGLGALVLQGPLTLGMAILVLRIARKQGAGVADLFAGLELFGSSLALFLLHSLLLGLWFLLFLIPGLIKTYSYSMAYFILADNPGISPLDAITRSRRMMAGKKLKLFRLHLFYLWPFILLPVVLGVLLAGGGRATGSGIQSVPGRRPDTGAASHRQRRVCRGPERRHGPGGHGNGCWQGGRGHGGDAARDIFRPGSTDAQLHLLNSARQRCAVFVAALCHRHGNGQVLR